MYCIPIGVERVAASEGSELLQVWLFLERNGTHCITVETVDEALAFAAENEFPLLSFAPVVAGQFVYLPIDLRETSALATFYTWKELAPHEQPMREAWRPFLWNKSTAGDTWGTNTYLKEIDLAPGTSCYTVIHTYIGSKA